MAYSNQIYTGNGTQTDFSFSFPYISEDHIKVEVAGVETSFDFVVSNVIRITPAPADQSVIVIQRVTPTIRLVDFQNGSIQDADDFDLDSNQLLYLIEESRDKVDGFLSRIPTDADNKMYSNIDMNTFKIENLGAPVNDNDAVRKVDLDNASNTTPDATETIKGKTRIATQAEANAGTDDFAYITALKLKTILDNFTVTIPDATELQKGLTQIATQAEANAGTDDFKYITALKLKNILDNFTVIVPDATETQKGIAEIATQAEVDAGTDDSRIVTPLKLENRIAQIPTGTIPTGSVIESFGSPTGFLEMDGSEQPKATYGDLYGVLGDASRKFSVSNVTTGISGITSLSDTTVCKFKNVFILGEGSGALSLYYSNDGLAWTDTGFNCRTGSSGFSVGSTHVVGIGGDGFTPDTGIVYSSDGITWNEVDPVSVGVTIIDVFYLNGFHYGVDNNGKVWYASDTDITNWNVTNDAANLVDANFLKASVAQGGRYIVFAHDTIGNEKIEVLIQKPDGKLNYMTHKILTVNDQFNSNAGGTINGLNGNYVDAEAVPGIGLTSIFLDLSTGYYANYINALPNVSVNTVNYVEWVSGNTYILGTDVGTYLTDLVSGVYTDITNGITNVSTIQITNDDEIIVGGQSGATVSFDRYSINEDATNFVLPIDIRYINNPSSKKFIKY